MTGSVDEGKAAFIYDSVSSIFVTVSYHIAMDKLLKYGLEQDGIQDCFNWKRPTMIISSN